MFISSPLPLLLLFSPSLFISTTQAALTYKGVDWSSLLVEERAGKIYRNAAGQQQPLEKILQSSGVNAVRQRIWNDPEDGNYNLEYNLELAQRAVESGLDVYLDFHYSDTWADPSHQTTPSAWSSYNIDDLSWAVYNYTLDTMNAFHTANIPLALVSIGNEIRAGMLWPLGSLDSSSSSYSPANVARLLHSASAGIKDSSLTPQPQILVHLDNGWNADTQEWWYDLILSPNNAFTAADYDVQAVSFYPFYNSAATMSALQKSLEGLKGKYGKDVMVVETNWPQKCSKPEVAFPEDVRDLTFSAEGQREWMEEVAGVVEGVGGSGVWYWEPAWLANAGLGSSCENNLMFDAEGRALSSLEVFKSL
ncbi:glycoside hydrolase family 53 protein [Sphaerulina musiva SO2202]|uniref:Arabinogalactan endo-beta-1,4-galactanase n=1 Tax=Sphaerulina musiva (strain SO2202) TaxID=692275 RepID=M3B1A0_SPHMS|nr:glycoside hydrolase family 53 protein [Sphaerulina musiva SO2202]EMF13557.1 glycoside hydrolase family 53 protein [Sphaerulina musiva SO2202]